MRHAHHDPRLSMRPAEYLRSILSKYPRHNRALWQLILVLPQRGSHNIPHLDHRELDLKFLDTLGITGLDTVDHLLLALRTNRIEARHLLSEPGKVGQRILTVLEKVLATEGLF
jgi:hypothetical protein